MATELNNSTFGGSRSLRRNCFHFSHAPLAAILLTISGDAYPIMQFGMLNMTVISVVVEAVQKISGLFFMVSDGAMAKTTYGSFVSVMNTLHA